MIRKAGKSIYWFASLLLCVLLLGASPSQADDLPSGPIRIVVGFGASSSADTVARLVARYISDHVGHPVIVENRPGNSSMTAADRLAGCGAESAGRASIVERSQRARARCVSKVES